MKKFALPTCGLIVTTLALMLLLKEQILLITRKWQVPPQKSWLAGMAGDVFEGKGHQITIWQPN